jgi:cell division protein ZipA
VLELIIVSVLLLLSFLAVAWYARLRSERRSKSLEQKTRLAEPPVDNEFGQYLDEQLALQQQHILGDVGEATLANGFLDEPEAVLSSEAIQSAAAHLEETPQLRQEVKTAPQEELNLTAASEPYFADRPIQPLTSTSSSKPKPKSAVKNKEWDIVLALTIMAAKDSTFSGDDISAALNYIDLEAGEMNIFHRHLPGQHGQTLFSVANLLAPGTLKPGDLPTLQTQGLLIFMRLPSPANGLLAFDAMLDAADKMAKRLNGQVKDEHRQTLTESTLENMRGRILNLNLKQQLGSIGLS